MNTCRFTDFMHVLEPWLNENYIHQARIDDRKIFTLTFVDGGCQTFRIDDCSSEQLADTIALLKKNGVQVAV